MSTIILKTVQNICFLGGGMKLFKKLYNSGIFELICILELGFGTTFMWTGFDTHSFILESVLHSVHERHPNRIDKYAGYYGSEIFLFMFLKISLNVSVFNKTNITL